MRIKYSYSLIAGIIAMSAISCSNDNEPSVSDDGNELKIFATIDGQQTRVNSEDSGDKFLPGEEITIGLRAGLKNIIGLYQCVTKEGTIDGVAQFETINGEKIINYGNGRARAYLNTDCTEPYDEYSYIKCKYIVQEDQSTIEKLREADVVRGDGISDNMGTGNSLTLVFRHLVSKFTFVIDEYENFGEVNFGELLPENVKFYFKSYESPLSIGTAGSWEDNDLPTFTVKEIKPLVTLDEVDGKHAFTVIIPYLCLVEKDEPILSFTLNGLEYIVKSGFNTSAFISTSNNYHYVTKLKVSGKYATTISQVMISDWDVLTGIGGNKVLSYE